MPLNNIKFDKSFNWFLYVFMQNNMNVCCLCEYYLVSSQNLKHDILRLTHEYIFFYYLFNQQSEFTIIL
jgi:hypothetical protein